MKQLTIEEAAQVLHHQNRFRIMTHRRPDGDTIGSAAALCRGLRQLGKEAYLLENPQVTQRYLPYVQGLTCPVEERGETVISVDVAGPEMFSKGAEGLTVDMLLDHHGSNPGFAGSGIIRPEAAATGEIVAAVLDALGAHWDPAMAEALYVALSTDTGCFRYSNTTAVTLRTAARCLEAGVDAARLNRTLFETVRVERLRLNAYLAQHVELLDGGRIALCRIPKQVEEETGVTEDDMEDVSSFARNIAGVELAVTFRTMDSGDTKLSIRSGPGYDAARIAQTLHGGGHRAAAGATVAGNQEEARRLVLQAIGR